MDATLMSKQFHFVSKNALEIEDKNNCFPNLRKLICNSRDVKRKNKRLHDVDCTGDIIMIPI